MKLENMFRNISLYCANHGSWTTSCFVVFNNDNIAPLIQALPQAIVHIIKI